MPSEKKKTATAEIDKLSFEDAVARLEEIVRALESADAALSDSLTLFEEGVSLTKHCNSLLDKAEQTVVKVGKTTD